jgi:hypothetical protein
MAETFEAYRPRVLSSLGDEEPIGVQQATPSQLGHLPETFAGFLRVAGGVLCIDSTPLPSKASNGGHATICDPRAQVSRSVSAPNVSSITHSVREHRPYSRDGTSPRSLASHPSMVALALISMLSCISNGLTAESASSALTLIVEATPGISDTVVRGALDETTAIWRAAGVTIEWHLSNAASFASDPPTVRVLLDDARRSVPGQDLPLGWISFNSSGVPDGIVHLSHRNVIQLIDSTSAYRDRPSTYRDVLAARALGRALAHELGHYLTASKGHSPSGLMKARLLVDELFSPARTGFMFNDDERQVAANGMKGKTIALP